jgi:hypothetical protein
MSDWRACGFRLELPEQQHPLHFAVLETRPSVSILSLLGR